MRRYTGLLRYTANNSGRLGQVVKVDLRVSFFPGRFTVIVTDGGARSKRELANRRSDYRARGIPQDLLAREKWRTEWYGRYSGPMYLNCPRIADVPRELQIRLICSWGAAFAVIEFRLADTYYQLSRRPHRGVNAWSRLTFMAEDDTEAPPPDEPSIDSRNPPADPPRESHRHPTSDTPI